MTKNTQEVAVQDTAALAEWNAMRPKETAKTVFNEIYVDNKKLTEDGEKNENFGKVFARTSDGVETEIDITTAQFFPVKMRVQVTGQWNDQLKVSDYYARESDDLNKIQIYSGETKQLVAEGNFFDYREAYSLKSSDIFYVAFEDKVYRWKMSVGGWEVVKELKRMISKSSAPVAFKIKSVTPTSKGNGGTWYNTLAFELGDKVDVAVAVDLIKKTNAILNGYAKQRDAEDSVAEEAQEVFLDTVSKTSIENVPF